jgi:hypothetical protein
MDWLCVGSWLCFSVSSSCVPQVSCDCKKVWLNKKIFLCLWQVRKAWHKQMCIKIRDVVVRAMVLKNMECIMHDIIKPN